MGVEARPKGRVDRMEVNMPASVTTKQVKNLFAENPRVPVQW